MEVVALVTRLGGVASRAEILTHASRAELEVALGRGELVRIARGRFATPGAEAAVLAARRISGVVTGLSAAKAHGWKLRMDPSRPVVTVPRNRHAPTEPASPCDARTFPSTTSEPGVGPG